MTSFRRSQAVPNAKQAADGPANKYAQWLGLSLMLAGSTSLAGGAFASTVFSSAMLGDALGGTGLVALACSSLPLLHAYGRWNRLKQALLETLWIELRWPRRLTVWERAGVVVPASREQRR
jgi:hypothetical protein